MCILTFIFLTTFIFFYITYTLILFFIILLSTGDAIFIGSVITIAFLITGIRLLIWLIESGDLGDNEYGPSPIIEEEDSETETQAEQ